MVESIFWCLLLEFATTSSLSTVICCAVAAFDPAGSNEVANLCSFDLREKKDPVS
jgi:hypothetical protein